MLSRQLFLETSTIADGQIRLARRDELDLTGGGVTWRRRFLHSAKLGVKFKILVALTASKPI